MAGHSKRLKHGVNLSFQGARAGREERPVPKQPCQHGGTLPKYRHAMAVKMRP
jgi:hypothetical protein